ncbi:hypothetical protein [Pedobacter sp. V48]|uniref:hypothetical protein n=1 Tax=Pedobacter sp. V48 TaxID=509635 RepID=UPI0003E462A0|nr:hypothetical protein [Pedobacter sp. V48]ETZ24317.1 hypothetical protein N824_14305 [Pedobacter sp. V48]
MVRGFEAFREYFKEFPDNYVIIGGTACDIILENNALVPRATKDMDIILIVEALAPGFVARFWEFIAKGEYERQEKSSDDRQYYRFAKPGNKEFPAQIELFARKPDVIELSEKAHLTPIPVDDDLSSLSAILLDDVYYEYMIGHSSVEDGIRHANTEALICLKAKAFLEISQRIAEGVKEDTKHLRKHKGDVFRLAITLAPAEKFELPEHIKSHLIIFMKSIAGDLPAKDIFKELGATGTDPEKVYQQLITNFSLDI